MLITCWSVKGGSGVSVVAAALAGLMAQRHGSAALLDLGGDQPALFGLAEPTGPGVLDWCDSSAEPARLRAVAVEIGSDLLLVPRGSGTRVTTAERARELAAAASALAPVAVVDAGPPLTARPGEGDAPTGEAQHASYLRELGTSMFVTRCCYLGLRRSRSLGVDADGVIVVDEPGRALSPVDVSEILGLPLIGSVEADPEVARAVDAGTLHRRVPRALVRGLRRAG